MPAPTNHCHLPTPQAGNVGDSTALWIDPRTVEVVELTEDHRLSNERERRRLADMGIQLSKNSRRLYGLNLSRGLGDKFLKDEDLGELANGIHVCVCVCVEGWFGGPMHLWAAC